MRRSPRSRVDIRLLAAAAVLASFSGDLHATTYLIATTADGAVNNGNCTLREALRAADTNAAVDACPAGGAADTITLPSGTYPFAGGETLTGSGSLTVQSVTLDPFAVTVDLSNAGRFLWLQGTASYVLGGLTITNGLAPKVDPTGGAISAFGVALRVFNFRFLTNSAGRAGGALSFVSLLPGTSLSLDHGSFLSNTVPGTGLDPAVGGAAYVSVANGSASDIRDVAFIGNSALESTLASQGGALFLELAQSGSIARCVRCNFQNNYVESETDNAQGGAVWVKTSNSARAEMADCRFEGNSAVAPTNSLVIPVMMGWAASGGSLSLERLFIDFNLGTSGQQTIDVLLFGEGAASVIELFDSQLSFGNSDGLWVDTDGTALLGHLTIADYPLFGASLSQQIGGQISLQNSILAFSSQDLLVPVDPILQTTNSIGGNPVFVNAGIGDYHLAALSPLINAGTNGAASLRAADLDHRTRISDAVTDRGCYEFDGLFADDFEVGDAGSWSAVTP